jgi:hypothetical protein
MILLRFFLLHISPHCICFWSDPTRYDGLGGGRPWDEVLFQVRAVNGTVHVIPVQGQRCLVSGPTPVGTGIGDEDGLVSSLEHTKCRVLDAHGGEQSAHQDRVDAAVQ